MNSIILPVMVVVLVTVLGASAQQAVTTPVPIVRQTIEKDGGNFKSSFEAANGITVEESGSQKQVGAKPEESGTVQRGSYSYQAPDGTPITVNWVADENGFQPTGAHLPVAPPMPPHVAKLLETLKASGAL